MQNFDFNKVTYRKPFLSSRSLPMKKIIGFDSEAYTTGEPFLFCTSLKDSFGLSDIPEIFFTRKYRDCNFMVYNLKYESGAILYNVPESKRRELNTELKMTYNGYKYRYLPHKYLRIIKGNNGVSFWDLQPFYKTSLDNASRIYLKDHKQKMKTKSFTVDYVIKHRKELTRYCIKDACLTQRLAFYLIRKLKRYGITVSSLYSPASISFSWFKENGVIITSWRFWNLYRGLLRYATESYAGGKFEITSRGSFKGYEYDIVSAYPYEIRNLYDITLSRVVYSRKYRKKAIYGFIRAKIYNNKGVYSPTGLNERGTRIYPAGIFYHTITKQEYEYWLLMGVKVDIISAYWIYKRGNSKPYYDRVMKLFKLKDRYKNTDRMMYNVAKIMLNSFYGKMVQINKKPDGSLEAASGWNIIYGAVITANVRIRVTLLQEYLRKDCLAVHTDSIITLKKLPGWLLSGGFGGLELTNKGKGMIIGCGMYQIGRKVAERGFKIPPDLDWIKILRSIGRKDKYYHKEVRVLSWIGALNNVKHKKINKFMTVKKTVNMDLDIKRLWFKKANGYRLLRNLDRSVPLIYLQNKPEWDK